MKIPFQHLMSVFGTENMYIVSEILEQMSDYKVVPAIESPRFDGETGVQRTYTFRNEIDEIEIPDLYICFGNNFISHDTIDFWPNGENLHVPEKSELEIYQRTLEKCIGFWDPSFYRIWVVTEAEDVRNVSHNYNYNNRCSLCGEKFDSEDLDMWNDWPLCETCYEKLKEYIDVDEVY